MKLNCPCGKQATWILLYGCEKHHHIWESHLCRTCLYVKVHLNENDTISDRIHTPSFPWTCLNVNYETQGTSSYIYCEIDGWYAKQLTPQMVERLFAEHREKMSRILRSRF